MAANNDNMPTYFIHPYGFTRSKTTFAAGQYTNFSDLTYRELVGSFISYVTDENIIVASFKPSWLTTSYAASDIDSWFKTKELSNWLLNATLEYTDLYGDGGFQVLPPAYVKHTRGADGSGEVVQYP
jgi:hypothetical protein